MNFEDEDVIVGDLIRISGSLFEKHYNILNVNNFTLTLDDEMPVSGSNLEFFIYKNERQ